MARDPEKHRQSALRWYYRRHEENKKRKRELYAARHEKERAEMDPQLAARMSALRTTPRRTLLQLWTQNLFAKVSAIISENARSRHAIKSFRWAVRIILARAERDGLQHPNDITPGWLAGFPRQTNDPRKEPIYRAGFGRMLVRLGLWSQEEYQLLRSNLALSRTLKGKRGRKPHGYKAVPAPPEELCRLVTDLVYRCGLSIGEIGQLRMHHLRGDGFDIQPSGNRQRLVPKFSRFIPFGDKWDELPKAVLDMYVRNEKPVEYLFFSRSPRNKKIPISKSTLNGAVRLQTGKTITALRNAHLHQDLSRARSLQEARFHFRTVHGLDNQYIHKVISGSQWHKGYAHEAVTIPIPRPYVLATMCASRSVPEDNTKPTIPEGGERQIIKWHDLLGYEITVDWKRSFAEQLGGPGRKSEKVLRLMFRIAFDFWFEGRRMKLPDIKDTAIRMEDRSLLDQLATTKVTVRDLAGKDASWSGFLFEYGSRKRAFRIPLIEEMNRCAWHNQCMVCWHPERDKIEREIAEAAVKNGRAKGYHLVASTYGVSYQSLKGHRGRTALRPGRRRGRRGHFSTGPIAPIVRFPRTFFAKLQMLSGTELMLYSLLQLEKAVAGASQLAVCPEWVDQRLGLQLTESALSIALNHVGRTRANLIDFTSAAPSGFRVTC